MNRFFTFWMFLSILTSGTVLNAQISIAFQGFEPGDSWTINTGDNVSSDPGASDTPANQRIRTGSNAHLTNNGSQALVLNGFADVAHVNRFVNVWLSSTSGVPLNGADAAENVRVFVSQTPTFSVTPDVTIVGNGNVRHGMDGTGVVMTDAGTATTFTYPSGGNKTGADAMSRIQINIPDVWTEVYLRVETINNDPNEFWNIDDIELLGTFDMDTEVYAPTIQLAAADIASTSDNSGATVDVFRMTIEDQGSGDGLMTKVTNIRIKPHATNTADWTDNIAGVLLDDGSSFLSPSSIIITDTEIDIILPDTELNIPDGGSTDVTIAVYLNTTNIADNSIFSCFVDAVDHGFTADASGSTFASSFFEGDFNSADFTIIVDASEMRFQTQPSDVEVSAVMAPSVTVAYTDANGNIDTDYDGVGIATTTMTTTGTFDGGATTSMDAVLGIATFSNLIHSVAGSNETLTASDANNWIGTMATVSSTTFNVNAPPSIVINEVLADPALGLNGDANGDGTRDAEDDEFVELVNTGTMSLDITGWTLSDADLVRHTFPTTIIPVNQSVVVFGGGMLANMNIPGIVQIASTGSLILNNGGDDVTLADGGGITMASFSYTSGANDQSFARSPDFTGSFVNHTTIATNPVPFSPGRNNANAAPLPISLNFFTGAQKQNTIQLVWQTATETNNDYVAIERSNDGRTFKEIGRKQGAGTSYQAKDYNFIDEKPQAGSNYYRLRQVDYDGTFDYFGPISVRFNENDSSSPISIFPVPAQDMLQVRFPEKGFEEAILDIFDMKGRLLFSRLAENKTKLLSLDIAFLPQGSYLIRWTNNQKTGQIRFIKQ